MNAERRERAGRLFWYAVLLAPATAACIALGRLAWHAAHALIGGAR